MTSTPELPVVGHAPATSIAPSITDECEALIVPVFTGEDGLELAATGQFDEDTEIAIWSGLVAVGATGSAGSVSTIPAPEDTGLAAIIAVGLGSSDDLDDERLRRGAGAAARAAAGFDTVGTTLNAFGMGATVEGMLLGAYAFRGHRAEPVSTTAKHPVNHVVFIDPSVDGKKKKNKHSSVDAPVELVEGELTADAGKDAYVRAVIRAEAVLLARNFVNTPPLELYPDSYAQAIKAHAKQLGVSVTILDENELAEQGYGGITAVGQGSTRKPRFVILSYTPKKARTSVALVGKGITFDTGGISLKPGKGMDEMTSDMAGSAAVVASIFAAARLKLDVTVTAYVPLAENMPGGGAQRPGDVITHYGGVTSEILNTDAEGRLVLADALARACEDNPDYIIETATLTGAQVAAFGRRTAGAMGSDEFRDRVAAIGRSVGESTWPVPIPEEVREDVTGSDIADIRNIGTQPFAGMQAAAAYLEANISGDVQWVHLDVAGPAWNNTGVYGYTPKRSTGCPTRTIIATLADIAANG